MLIAAASPLLIAGVIAAALLAVRFNRPLARAHVALFQSSREEPRWWQMLFLRSAWFFAGAGVLVVAALALVGVVNL
jgi:hypothetical protein